MATLLYLQMAIWKCPEEWEDDMGAKAYYSNWEFGNAFWKLNRPLAYCLQIGHLLLLM